MLPDSRRSGKSQASVPGDSDSAATIFRQCSDGQSDAASRPNFARRRGVDVAKAEAKSSTASKGAQAANRTRDDFLERRACVIRRFSDARTDTLSPDDLRRRDKKNGPMKGRFAQAAHIGTRQK